MASLADIARATQLSTTTVSLALSGKAPRYRIGAATVQRVQGAARKLGYTPNQLARSLRTRKTNTIGLVVADITTSFFSRLALEAETVASEHGCHVIVANTSDDPARERAAIQTLLARSVDGLIVSSVGREMTAVQARDGAPLPVVYIDRVVEGRGVHCVVTDNRLGMYQLTRHILEQGSRTIAFIGGLPHLSTHRERLEGFAQALGERGLSPDPRLVFDGGFTADSAEALTRRMLARRTLPDALIAAALPLFEGVLVALRERGIDLGALRLATFDDHPLLDFLRVPVCSVRQDCAAIGRSSVEALLAVIAGTPVDPITTIAPSLIIRPTPKEVQP